MDFWKAFGFWYLAIVASALCVGAIYGIIWRIVYSKKEKELIPRLREEFAKRYPRFNADAFIPIVTLQSKCCRSIFWKMGKLPRYFCHKCGKEHDADFKIDANEKNLNDAHAVLDRAFVK